MQHNMKPIFSPQHILVAGSGRLVSSLSVCLLQAGFRVTLLHEGDALPAIDQHLAALQAFAGQTVGRERLTIAAGPDPAAGYEMAIAVTPEDPSEKQAMIRQLEACLPEEAPLAINMESIALSELQQHSRNPRRIIGANWAEPVYNTCFLEVIINDGTLQPLAAEFCKLARERWQKDPYLLTHGRGIRARMMCSLIREACYLVENGYVGVEDIDRACRNDPGYYFPFAGNFRYMDLMGGFMYGIVMQDLNPTLSKETHIPDFCLEAIQGEGMAGGRGFYEYRPGEAAHWEALFRKFSFQIHQIIHRYPFRYEEVAVNA